ncbi:hypothetical protein RhiirA4_546710 [Rhizophagus irregularis]|uniref:Uncharacterized protein n=1 Tax=Rhizophagus irregularis TaxID=588596 RepID=A0A2I1GYK5_9GLOM|nr:hypothetical protein RhiirA4_546710 [Rhizophagus irregularis]
MPAKLNTICYVHNIAEHLTQDFTVKEITGITRTKDDDPTKVNTTSIKPLPILDFNDIGLTYQNMRSTTAILENMYYRNNNTSQQSPNLPWMNQQGSNNNRSYRPPRGATSRRRG